MPEERSNCGTNSLSAGLIACGDKTFNWAACAILAVIREPATTTAKAAIDWRNFHDVGGIGAPPQLAASSFRTGCRQNVCYWHIANMHSQSAMSAFGVKADIGRAFVRRAHRGRLRPPSGLSILAYVGDALLGNCFGRGSWLRRQLKHRRFLTLT